MFKKKITIITTIISVILTMTSCGNTASSEERTNTTISYSDSSVAEEIDTSSDVSSIDEVDSTEDSSDVDSIDDSSETDSSEDDSSEVEKVTTTVDDSSKVEKTTTTTTTKKTTTQPVETTTTQPVVTQAPITEAPKTTTIVKQTEAPKTTTQKPVVTTKPAVQTTKTTTKATTKSTTKTTTKQTTKVTSTQPTDNKYMAAMKKISKVNAHINKDFTESDCALVREYLINLVYKKYPKSKAHNVKFIPYFDKNGNPIYDDDNTTQLKQRKPLKKGSPGLSRIRHLPKDLTVPKKMRSWLLCHWAIPEPKACRPLRKSRPTRIPLPTLF